MQSSLDKPLGAPLQTCSFRNGSFFKTSFLGQSLTSSNMNKRMLLLPYVKASEAASDLASADSLTKFEQSSSAWENVQKSTFPNGFEKLILELCDETTIAEPKIKIEAFEMYIRRDVSSSDALISTIPPNALPIQAPPIPSKLVSESGPLAPPAIPQKPPCTPASPFINVPSAKVGCIGGLA